MNPSSRTPEGEPNQCPICGHELRMEPSRPPGDAPCPHCGHLLWFPSAKPSATPPISLPESIFRLWTSQGAQTPDHRYLDELISELASFLAARHGAIWILAGTQLRRKALHQEAEFPETPSDRERGNQLLREVAATGRSLISQPGRESHVNEAAPEPSDSLLLAVPVKRDNKTVAIVEIAQEPGATTELQRSNLRFLEQICALASDRIGKLVDADSVLDTAHKSEAVAVSSSAAVGKKRWWQVWKN